MRANWAGRTSRTSGVSNDSIAAQKLEEHTHPPSPPQPAPSAAPQSDVHPTPCVTQTETSSSGSSAAVTEVRIKILGWESLTLTLIFLAVTNTFNVRCDTIHEIQATFGGRRDKWKHPDTVPHPPLSTQSSTEEYRFHSDKVLGVASLGDGTMISAGGGRSDKTVRLWDSATGCQIRTFDEKGDAISAFHVPPPKAEMEFFMPKPSPSHRVAYTGGHSGTSYEWDTVTGECLRSFEGGDLGVSSLYATDFSLYVGSVDSVVREFDLQNGSMIRTYQVIHMIGGSVGAALALWRDPSSLYVAYHDSTVRRFSIAGELIQAFLGHSGAVTCLSGNELAIYTGSKDNTIREWSTNVKQQRMHSEEDMRIARPLDYTSGRALGESSLGLTWCATDCERIFTGHTLDITSVLLNGDYLFSSSYDTSIMQWDLESGLCIVAFVGHTRAVMGICLAEGMLYSAGGDQTVRRHVVITDLAAIGPASIATPAMVNSAVLSR